MSKPSIFSMSLLPVVLLVLLILGAGYFLMSGDLNNSKIFNHEPEMRRLNGFPTTLDSTVTINRQRAIIHNDQELAQFFNTVDSTAKLTLADKIDFTKEVLIGISTETQTDKRSTVKVKKLYLNNQDKSIVVSIAQTDL